MQQASPRHVSLPCVATPQPGKRAYTRMEEHRPEMAKLLVTALQDAAGESVVAAVVDACAEEFAKRHCHDGRPMDSAYLARDTLRRLSQHGDLADLHRSGRPRVAADEDVARFLRIFLQGNGKTGDEWWGFTSLAHALHEKKELRDLLLKMGISQDHLWHRMEALHIEQTGKRLNKISIVSRVHISPATMRKRLDKARLWKGWGFEKLCKVVWIDEKQEYLRAGGTYKCYAPVGVKSMQRGSSVKLGKSEKVKYEAAVSGFGGAILLQFVTGTTGREQWFPVRTSVPTPRHLDPAALVARPPCLI